MTRAAWSGRGCSRSSLGVLGDLRPAVERTRARTRRPSGPPGRDASELGMGLRILVDELAPGRARAHRAAAAERTRLAADLHRRDRPGGPRRAGRVRARRVAGASRGVASGASWPRSTTWSIERHSVVLEELGLVAAIERLVGADRGPLRMFASRSMSTSTVRCVATSDPGRPPREVERAAFRVDRPGPRERRAACAERRRRDMTIVATTARCRPHDRGRWAGPRPAIRGRGERMRADAGWSTCGPRPMPSERR